MAEQNTTEQFDNDKMSLKGLILKIKEWYHFLLTQLKLIVLMGVIGGVIGLTYAYFKKPIYIAVLTFALEDEKTGGGGLSGALSLASSFGIDLGSTGGSAFAGANLMELMKSRKLIEKTLLSPVLVNGKAISLVEHYINVNELRQEWKWKDKLTLKNIQFLPDADRGKFSLQQDSLLREFTKDILNENLNISQQDKKISIINVNVNSISEIFSKMFCENLLKETSEFYVETKSKKAKMNIEILQKQADSIRAELNGAITGVATATDNVFNLNMAMNVKRSPSARRQVDVQANTAILTQLVGNLELAKVTLRKETPLVQIIDKPIYPLEKEKVSKLKSFLLGGFLAGFLTILYLVLGRLYKKIIA